jgi:hypothetical protein
MQNFCENTVIKQPFGRLRNIEDNDKLDLGDIAAKLECGWNWPRVMSDGWLCVCSVEHSGSIIRESYSIYYLLLRVFYIPGG